MTEDAYSLRGGEIEARHDEYIHKLKEAVKILKERSRDGAPESLRRMDSDDPLDSPDRWDI